MFKDCLKERLLEIREEQKEFKKKFGNSYNSEWDGYICVLPDGRLITPDYVTKNYPEFLKKHNLTRICFHNVRHTCATLMQMNDVGLNYIKEYLGHSDISTTANTYSHLDYSDKIPAAKTMEETIYGKDNETI